MIPITYQAPEIIIEPPEETVLLSTLKTIREQSKDETINHKIQAIEANIARGASEDEIKELLKNAFESQIKGSPSQALLTGTLTFFFGFPPSIGVNNATALTSLAPAAKTFVAWVSSLTGGLGRLHIGITVNRNGGRDLTLIYLVIALAGILITTVISETTDLSSISDLSNLSAQALLLSSLLAGLGLSTFSQLSSVMLWQEENKSDKASALFGGGSGLSPGLFGLVRLAFLKTLGADNGLSAMSALLISSIVGASLAFKYSDRFRLNNPPCHQIMEKYSLTQSQAQPIAQACNQFYFPKISSQGEWTALLLQLKNTKTRIAILNYYIAFGTFLGITSAGTISLLSWGYSHNDALLFTSLFSIWSNVCRAGTAWPINFLDKDPLGGGALNTFGSVLTAAGALSLFIPHKVPSPAETAISYILMGAGLGINASTTFKMVSSEVKKEKTYPVSTPLDNAKTNALISCFGTFGSMIYILGGGLLASFNKDDPSIGYVEVYGVIAFLSLAAGSLSLYMSYTNKEALKPALPVTEVELLNHLASPNAFFPSGSERMGIPKLIESPESLSL